MMAVESGSRMVSLCRCIGQKGSTCTIALRPNLSLLFLQFHIKSLSLKSSQHEGPTSEGPTSDDDVRMYYSSISL